MAVKNNHLLTYVVISILAFTLGVGHSNASEYENYYGIKMTNQEYNTLINLGFNSDEIYYMDLQTFEENKDLNATLVAKTEKYYKTIYTGLDGKETNVEITKNEYDNQGTINSRGYVSTPYKDVVSAMSQNGDKYRFKVSIAWKNMPSTKSYDIIGIGFDDPVYINSSVYFNYYWCNSSGDCTTASDYYDKKKISTGGTAVYKFPSAANSLSAALWYDVSKNTSNTITTLTMHGDYSHATSSVSASNASNHTITYNGILLGNSIIGSYDELPCAITAWDVNW